MLDIIKIPLQSAKAKPCIDSNVPKYLKLKQ